MRALIVLFAALIVLALVGWITFSKGPGQSSIHLETDKIKQDTDEMMESGAELLDDAEQAIDRAGHSSEEVGDLPREPAESNATDGEFTPQPPTLNSDPTSAP